MAGGDVANTHAMNSPNGATRITLDTVKDLKVKWFYATVGGVAVTPTVEPGGVYFTTQHGALIKLDPATGRLLWQKNLPGLARSGAGGASTTSPAIATDRVIVGFNGYVMAIEKATGALIWKTLVDPHPLAKMHISPVILGGHVYAGMASTEEIASLTPGYVPSFRGSAFSLSLATGAIEWKTYTVPAGYTGGAIWGGSPVADATRDLVFFTNGDNYTVPARVGACIRSAGRDVPAQRACLDPTDYVNSFLALSMSTGKVVWTRPTVGADAWLPAGYCVDPAVFICPTVNRPYDVDFAQGPSLFYVHDFEGTPDDRGGHGTHWMLGAGQKTGTYWGLNRTPADCFGLPKQQTSPVS